VLKRILDSELSAPADPFRLGDLFTGVQDSVWAELKSSGASVSINSFRRSLQREHLRRMIGMVLKDAAAPEDARTLARFTLASLKTRVQGALGRPGVKMTLETARTSRNRSLESTRPSRPEWIAPHSDSRPGRRRHTAAPDPCSRA